MGEYKLTRRRGAHGRFAFWFSFAVGSAGGLLFSVLAIVFVMPIFMKLPER